MPPPTSAKKPAASKVQSALRPPEERFWIRYSPHHELPVSVAGSFLLHVLGVGLIALIVIGALSGLFGGTKPVEVQPIEIVEAGGGGGNPEGVGTGPNTYILPAGTEAKPQEVTKPLISSQQRVDTPDLKAVDKNPEIPLQVPSGEAVRLIPEQSTDAVLGQLDAVGKMARARIDGLLAGKGKGGSGSGGGLGSGEGTGTGDLKGPSSGNLNNRTRRQQRWVMIFNTRNGQDYLRQLQHLGAIVAVPQMSGDYMIYRDLAKRPLRGQVEDIQLINRIYWVDDKPQSVGQLAEAMGIFPPPPYIAAFFPETLESKLRGLEEKRYRGPEDNIEETRFHVTSRGGKYEPVLMTQPKLKGQ